MYIIVWKYKIKPEFKFKFESDYGSSGVWNSLFCQSENYLSSQLHQDVLDAQVYLLIDAWTDQKSYDYFIKENSQPYEKLSKNCEGLYDVEKLVGTYCTL